MRRRIVTQATAAFLAALMVITNVDVTAFAYTGGNNVTTASVVNSIAPLSEDIAVQKLEVGASEADIVMPSTISATVTQYTSTTVEMPVNGNAQQLPTQAATGSTNATQGNSVDSTQNTTSSTTSSATSSTTSSTTSDTTAKSSSQAESGISGTSTLPNESTLSGKSNSSGTSDSTKEFNIQQHDDKETTADTSSTSTAANTSSNMTPASNVKTTASTKQQELPVTWKIDTDKSTSSTFSSAVAGNEYVYVPVLSDGIVIPEEVTMPSIKVTIVNKKEVEFTQSSTIDGVTITVTAEKGVFPEGVTLSVKKITDNNTVKQLTDAAEAAEVSAQSLDGNDNKEIISEDIYAYDIAVLDKDGREIQPDESKGTVTVTFTNPEPEKYAASDMSVFHVDKNTLQATQLDTQVNSADNTIQAKAASFSPYVLKLARYLVQLHCIQQVVQ